MKDLRTIIAAICVLFLLSGCGASLPVTSNHNVHQTNVVLSQNNYDIVRHVEAEVSATYVFGIGGVSRKALKSNAVAELTREANLTGSQALVNVTVMQGGFTFAGIYSKVIYTAEGTVIEFK